MFLLINVSKKKQVIQRNLPHKNSCGCNYINTKLLKITETAITKSLTILTNQVLHTGVFSDKLQISKSNFNLHKGRTNNIQ